MTRVYALVAALIAALVLSSVAVAGGSLVTSYGGQGQQALVKTTTASKGKAKASSGTSGAKASGTLPFTGLDLGLLFVGGTTLVLTGAGLRRSARNKY